MHSKEVLHRFIQQGHDPAGWAEGLEAKGESSLTVRIEVEL